MKRFVTINFDSSFALMLGTVPVSATERLFAFNGNGIAGFTTGDAGNVVGANLTGFSSRHGGSAPAHMTLYEWALRRLIEQHLLHTSKTPLFSHVLLTVF